jgi:hypothetical protein
MSFDPEKIKGDFKILKKEFFSYEADDEIEEVYNVVAQENSKGVVLDVAISLVSTTRSEPVCNFKLEMDFKLKGKKGKLSNTEEVNFAYTALRKAVEVFNAEVSEILMGYTLSQFPSKEEFRDSENNLSSDQLN